MNHVAVALAAIVVLGATPATTQTPAAPSAPSPDADPFAGIWNDEALERAVVWPQDALDKDDLPEAERRMDELLARAGDDHARRHHLMTAWAIQLILHSPDKDGPLLWLRRANEEARAAYPGSRLLAMALGDYGHFEVQHFGGTASPEAEAALVEALDIQLRLLGPRHPETLATSAVLGQLRGDPVRTGGDPARIAEASRLFGAVLAADPPEESGDYDQTLLDWMDMLIANDRPDTACAILGKLPRLERKLRIHLQYVAYQTGLKLRDHGFAGHAAPLLNTPLMTIDWTSKPSRTCGRPKPAMRPPANSPA